MAGPTIVNLAHLTPDMAGVLRHSAGLVGALLERSDVGEIHVVTTAAGLDGLSGFGLDLDPAMLTILPDGVSRAKLLAAVATLVAVPWIAHRRGASTVLNLDYYFSPALGTARSISMVTDVQFIDRPASFGIGARWSRTFFMRLAARFCDVVLGISHTSAQRFVEAFPDASGKTEIVPMGIDARDEMPRVERSGDALFVGTTNDHKNLRVVVDALRAGLLPDLQLAVAGRPGSYEPTLRAAMQDPAVGSHIKRLGRVSDPELDELYDRASLLIAPSFYEGFDMPTIEAMAAGADVVASDLPVHREILGDHAEYFSPNDPVSLSAAVSAARGRSADQRAAAIEHARSYTWDRSADRLAAVL